MATTERHWNDTSVPERPELEVLLATNLLEHLSDFMIQLSPPEPFLLKS